MTSSHVYGALSVPYRRVNWHTYCYFSLIRSTSTDFVSRLKILRPRRMLVTNVLALYLLTCSRPRFVPCTVPFRRFYPVYICAYPIIH